MVSPGTLILVPGTPKAPTFPLARYRSPELIGAARAFTQSTTEKGDLLLAIGAISGETIKEVVDVKRRIVALSRNPVDLLCAALDLEADAAQGAQVQTALTQLGDLPKGDRPLILHIKSQYETRCPHCHQSGIAEWFAWDRERGQPFAKRVACPQCDQAREGPVDAVDLERAGTYPVRSGPAYHLALSRAAGQDPDTLARTAQLIELYTPRNLSALMTLVQRMPQLHHDENVLRAIHAMLFEAFDAGSALTPYRAPDMRPRSLRVPQKFLERNVWMVLERAAADYQAHHGLQSQTEAARRPQAESLLALLLQSEPGYLLLGRSVQSLRQAKAPVNFDGVILHLAPPDATFWALTVLWSLWLWGESVPRDLRGFLQRRRLDWDWYQRGLAVALDAIQPYLAPKASILAIVPGPELDAVRALTDAAHRSKMTIDRWIACPPNGYRVRMQADPEGLKQRPNANGANANGASAASATAVAAQILQERGEPLRLPLLRALTMLHSQKSSSADLDLSTASPLTKLAETHVWFRTPPQTAPPLGDRLETVILRHLTATPRWEHEALLAAIYQQFCDHLSPEPELTEAIIQAYTMPDAQGLLILRPEDEPGSRRREQRQLERDLRSLGDRLGYSSARHLGGDLVWREGGTVPYLFRVTSSATLAEHLLNPPPRCDGRRCLVVPGGRAALIALKLRRDPRLAARAADQHWIFIKFRHLRRMIAEMTDRAEIEVFLGLDPIVEQQGAQIPLPIQLKRAGE